MRKRALIISLALVALCVLALGPAAHTAHAVPDAPVPSAQAAAPTVTVIYFWGEG